GCDRLDLGVDVVRVARCNRDVDSPELIADTGTGISGTAPGVHSAPSVRVCGDGVKIRRTTACRHRSAVHSVRAVLIQIVLHRGRETADAERGDNPGRSAVVDERETG